MSLHRSFVFVEIRRRVEDALRAAEKARDQFKGEAINWGDLDIVSVEHYEAENGSSGYRAYIEEASDSCPKFTKFLEEHAAGSIPIEIFTRW